MNDEEKTIERLKLFKEYEDGNVLGSIDKLKNVNLEAWKIFKKISRFYGNSEGAAFGAVVLAWLQIGVNKEILLSINESKKEV